MSGCSHPATKHKEGKGTCATGKCQVVHTLLQNTKKGRVLVQPANVRLFIHCYKTQRREGYLCNRQMSGSSHPATKHKAALGVTCLTPESVPGTCLTPDSVPVTYPIPDRVPMIRRTPDSVHMACIPPKVFLSLIAFLRHVIITTGSVPVTCLTPDSVPPSHLSLCGRGEDDLEDAVLLGVLLVANHVLRSNLHSHFASASVDVVGCAQANANRQDRQ